MIRTINSGISYQLRDIYSICRCCWNVATYKWKVHNGKTEVIFFCRNVSFLTDHSLSNSGYMSRFEADIAVSENTLS